MINLFLIHVKKILVIKKKIVGIYKQMSRCIYEVFVSHYP